MPKQKWFAENCILKLFKRYNMANDLLNDMHGEGCPQCGSMDVHAVKYTWWGGLLGPKMFHHTKCEECKYTFNSKTRKSNKQPILLYLVVSFLVFFMLGYLFYKNFWW